MENVITPYSIALFLHIVGALGLFAALGLEWTSLSHLRRAATAEQAHEWLGVFGSLRRIYPISMLTILVAGLYMTAAAWRGAAWIAVALVAMVLIAVLGAALGGRVMAPVGRALAVEHGQLSSDLRHRLQNPVLWASISTRVAIGLGIIFLMTVKPDLAGALLAIGVAGLLGLVSSLPVWRRMRVKEQAA